MPPLKGNGGKFRQFQGRTSTDGLAAAVEEEGGRAPSPTRVNKPNDVFDLARPDDRRHLVPPQGNKVVSISHMAAENGWALPAYYNSMNPSEINALQDLFEEARKKNRGIWREFERKIGALKRLPYRKDGTFRRAAEKRSRQKGASWCPRSYRRQLKFDVIQLNNLGPADLPGTSLAGSHPRVRPRGSKDAWTTRAAILRNPTMKRPTRAPNDSLSGAVSTQKTFPAGNE